MAYTDYKSQGLPNSNTYSDGATHWRIRAGHSDFHFQHTDEGVHGCGNIATGIVLGGQPIFGYKKQFKICVGLMGVVRLNSRYSYVTRQWYNKRYIGKIENESGG